MMRIKALVFAISLVSGGSLPAFAACSGQVTAISLQSGGPAVHVTVDDQNCNSLAPSSLTWSSSPAVTITPDAAPGTGFNMTAPAGTAAQAVTETATHTATGIHAALTVNIAPPPVTALQFTSP